MASVFIMKCNKLKRMNTIVFELVKVVMNPRIYEEDAPARASASIQVNFCLVSPCLRKG